MRLLLLLSLISLQLLEIATMKEKASMDISDVSHNEKVVHATKPKLAEAAGRRQAVAMNIVENPLLVSFAILDLYILWRRIKQTLTVDDTTAQLQRAGRSRCPGICHVASDGRACRFVWSGRAGRP